MQIALLHLRLISRVVFVDSQTAGLVLRRTPGRISGVTANMTAVKQLSMRNSVSENAGKVCNTETDNCRETMQVETVTSRKRSRQPRELCMLGASKNEAVTHVNSGSESIADKEAGKGAAELPIQKEVIAKSKQQAISVPINRATRRSLAGDFSTEVLNLGQENSTEAVFRAAELSETGQVQQTEVQLPAPDQGFAARQVRVPKKVKSTEQVVSAEQVMTGVQKKRRARTLKEASPNESTINSTKPAQITKTSVKVSTESLFYSTKPSATLAAESAATSPPLQSLLSTSPPIKQLSLLKAPELPIATSLPAPSIVHSASEIEAAIAHLTAVDPKLAALIPLHPRPDFSNRCRSPFRVLVRSILSQQLAGKAAATIHGRFVNLCGEGPESVTPSAILSLPLPSLRTAGLSGNKASYVVDLARHFHEGILDDAHFDAMDDDAIMKALVAVKGIGVWTVHMFMMFSLYRPDVLPVGDLGVRKGMQKVYGLKELPKPGQMESIAEKWRPFRSIGCFYMWQSVSVKPPEPDKCSQ
eukprot:TRINITY_DN4658_c0_g2_i1.p1 TRINITY_DN4658_c0_g2~~TRINITY_DN4658_c0_g2_i1.p1  ORF type:complete len:530 (+),score=89.27 TRINITY_DN4658_c0_g2_i1:236-1825(+)